MREGQGRGNGVAMKGGTLCRTPVGVAMCVSRLCRSVLASV